MRPLTLATISTCIGLAYAVLRYHEAFFGSHPTAQLPLFLFNKALSVAALLMIATAVGARTLAGLFGKFGDSLQRDRRAIGMTGFGMAAAHSAMSFVLLTPGYFGKFYAAGSGKMNLVGELSTLAGIAALALLVWQARLPAADEQSPRKTLRRLGLAVLALSAVHVAVMGWGGWMKPADWPGGLPPITLWSFGIALLGLLLAVVPLGERG